MIWTKLFLTGLLIFPVSFGLVKLMILDRGATEHDRRLVAKTTLGDIALISLVGLIAVWTEL